MSNSTDNKWVYDIATVQVSKGGKQYIRVNKDVTLKKGQSIFFQSQEEKLQKLVDNGKITEDEAERQLEAKSFIKFHLNLAPENKQS
jgi:hypothetical protein